MNRNMIRGIIVLIALLGIAGVFMLIQNERAELKQLEQDAAEAAKPLEDSQKPQSTPHQADVPPPQPDKTDKNGGHTHVDGTLHEGTHEHPPYTPPPVQIPADITDPDVLEAWKHLDYISKNRHEWGKFSPRTLELIDEMTPMPAPPKVEGDEAGVIAWLDELSALRDPRSAEILIKYQMESGVIGNPVDDALVAMGPGAVPALVARLDDLSGDSYLIIPMRLLTRIVTAHQLELVFIVEHIIIPKVKAIAAGNTVYKHSAVNVLAQLQQ